MRSIQTALHRIVIMVALPASGCYPRVLTQAGATVPRGLASVDRRVRSAGRMYNGTHCRSVSCSGLNTDWPVPLRGISRLDLGTGKLASLCGPAAAPWHLFRLGHDLTADPALPTRQLAGTIRLSREALVVLPNVPWILDFVGGRSDVHAIYRDGHYTLWRIAFPHLRAALQRVYPFLTTLPAIEEALE